MSGSDPADQSDRQYAALEVLSVGNDDATPIDEVLTQLRAVRRAVAAQKRASVQLNSQ